MREKKKMKKVQAMSPKETWLLSLMALPGVLLIFVFRYLTLTGNVIAFQRFNPNKGIFGSQYIGFKNFEFFFKSDILERLLRNTVGYALAFLLTGTIAAVALAIMFYFLRSRNAYKVYNTVFLLPRFMSSIIIGYIVLTVLSQSSGLLNQVITFFGGEPVKWYMESKPWPFILTMVNIWAGVGGGCILYYASLMAMDHGLLESAMLDGASRWQQIWHILIPHLVPLIALNLIINLGGILGGDFSFFYNVTRNSSMLYETTDIINTYTFRALFDGSVARGAAIGLFQSVAGMLLVIITNLIVRKVSPERALF